MVGTVETSISCLEQLTPVLGAHCDPVDPQSMRIFIEQNGDRDSAVANLELDRSMAYHGPREVPKLRFTTALLIQLLKINLENTITPEK